MNGTVLHTIYVRSNVKVGPKSVPCSPFLTFNIISFGINEGSQGLCRIMHIDVVFAYVTSVSVSPVVVTWASSIVYTVITGFVTVFDFVYSF